MQNNTAGIALVGAQPLTDSVGLERSTDAPVLSRQISLSFIGAPRPLQAHHLSLPIFTMVAIGGRMGHLVEEGSSMVQPTVSLPRNLTKIWRPAKSMKPAASQAGVKHGG
jgi:hypothetical protein